MILYNSYSVSIYGSFFIRSIPCLTTRRVSPTSSNIGDHEDESSSIDDKVNIPIRPKLEIIVNCYRESVQWLLIPSPTLFTTPILDLVAKLWQ